MGIKVRNVRDSSALRKWVKTVEVYMDSSLSVAPSPIDLSNGYTIDFMVPHGCRLERHTWSMSADHTASSGFAVTVAAPVQGATLVATGNIWSASDALSFGVDWSADRPITNILGSSRFLSAGSIVTVTVSALSGTKALVAGALYFDIDERADI